MRPDLDIFGGAAAFMIIVDAVGHIAFDAGDGGLVFSHFGHRESSSQALQFLFWSAN